MRLSPAGWTKSIIVVSSCTVLFGCGGGGGSSGGSASLPPGGVQLQVVSFGDSLSDVGTYAGTSVAGLTRGRYTTNPGEVWTQKVAEYYGGTLTAAYLGGYGTPLTASTGYGYAQGGARVTDPIGEGHGSGGAADYSASTTVPVTTQIQNYLSVHGAFNGNQLVLVNGGANDIFESLTTISTAVANDVAKGMTLQTAVAQETQTTLAPVATALAQAVGTILSNGATHVVVSNIPDIGQAPVGQAVGGDTQSILSGMASTFNAAFVTALQSTGNASKVILIDAYSWQDGLIANYVANGYSVSNTATACNLAAMTAVATAEGQSDPSSFTSALYCAPQYFVVANADQTYMFADIVHPTTHTHALFATYVEQQIAASGLGR